MRRLAFVLWCLLGASTKLLAQGLPAYCADPVQREQLRRLGPVVSVGASASSGLFAKSFPLLAAQQLCLTPGAGFESRHSFGGGSQFPFLKRMFIEQRPKVIVALDYLHHSSKRRRYTAETRQYLDAEIARLTLDCRHPEIDCSPGGEFHFAVKENYRPLVLLGDIYAFYAVDCTRNDPFINADSHDKNVGCTEDYDNMNRYLWQKARENPRLVMFPVDAFYRQLHRGLPVKYEVDGRLGPFFVRDLFWDGFHPWSEPGAQVLANLVLAKLNEQIARGTLGGAPGSGITIPYLPVAERYFKPYTGIVLLSEAAQGMIPGAAAGAVRLVNERGETRPLAFTGAAGWTYEWVFERHGHAVFKVGSHPLVLSAAQREDGAMVLGDEQWALLRRVLADMRHRFMGGIILPAR